MMNSHSKVWAKQRGVEAPYPLLAHLLDTATVAGELYEVWLRPELRKVLGLADSRQVIEWIAGSHDIGKACPVFQYQQTQQGKQWDGIRDNLCISEPQLGDIADSASNFYNDFFPDICHHQKISALLLQGGAINPDSRVATSWQFLPALGHHGYFNIPGWSRAENNYFFEDFRDSGWKDLSEDILQCLEEGVGIKQSDLPTELSSTATIILSGLTVLADRIASGNEWVVCQQKLLKDKELDLDNPSTWLACCKERARKRIAETVGIYHGWNSDKESQQAILGSWKPRPLQEEAMRVGAGLWNVMAPTGIGKTEAALLRHAKENERLIFLLPTQATSNALMRRIHRYYADTPNVAALVHSLASTEDFYRQPLVVGNDSNESSDLSSITSAEKALNSTGLFPTEFVRSGSSRLLAPVCVGTVDQALLGALPAKWTHLRLLALANAHVVIDEVHTLDQYQSVLLTNLLFWLRATRTRVTFLSATLASAQRAAYLEAYTGKTPYCDAEFPLLENIDTEGTCVRSVKLKERPHKININLEYENYSDLTISHLNWVRTQRQRYPEARIGVICNTVVRAQELTRALGDEYDIVILHSRMTAEHRRRNAEHLEREIGSGNEGAGIIVIGTQAIEASLDIDLDLLRTELCPAASLIQRAGRLWRTDDLKRSTRVPNAGEPVISVVVIQGNDGEKLPYLASELARVENWLANHQEICIPENCQEFVDTGTILLENLSEEQSEGLDEVAKNAFARVRAKSAVYDMKYCLSEASQVKSFAAMTRCDKNLGDESATRLIDVKTTRLIVCGDSDIIPGAWQGTADELRKLCNSDWELVRKALQASVPVSVTGRNKAMIKESESLFDASSLLCRYSVLENGADYYDPVVGLVISSD